jgi:anhydro-N-acetylmuramic acid kinase
MNSYRILGIMSGTSMDGIDIADVSFSKGIGETWEHVVHQTETIAYPIDLENELRKSIHQSSQDLCILDKRLGLFFGTKINEFIDKNGLDKAKIDAIASHGHTIFHQPERGFTLQIGCGTSIALKTRIQVINDFRTKDVLTGGQGAPLVPIGDSLLFSTFADAFLNLGGFSNVCILSDPILAFDISPGNLPLNDLMLEHFQLPYDQNGGIARSGEVIPKLIKALNALDYYNQPPPKSLGTEWINAQFSPIINQFSAHSASDLLHTITLHIALQISKTLNNGQVKKVLITGGGGKNAFLIESIQSHFRGKIILPELELIDFKEAIIFGFLGALYLDDQVNTIASVTGAKHAVKGGVLHTP